jgi:hypothetical protein
VNVLGGVKIHHVLIITLLKIVLVQKLFFKLRNSNNSFKTCAESKSSFINSKIIIIILFKLVPSEILLFNLQNRNNSY